MSNNKSIFNESRISIIISIIGLLFALPTAYIAYLNAFHYKEPPVAIKFFDGDKYYAFAFSNVDTINTISIINKGMGKCPSRLYIPLPFVISNPGITHIKDIYFRLSNTNNTSFSNDKPEVILSQKQHVHFSDTLINTQISAGDSLALCHYLVLNFHNSDSIYLNEYNVKINQNNKAYRSIHIKNYSLVTKGSDQVYSLFETVLKNQNIIGKSNKRNKKTWTFLHSVNITNNNDSLDLAICKTDHNELKLYSTKLELLRTILTQSPKMKQNFICGAILKISCFILAVQFLIFAVLGFKYEHLSSVDEVLELTNDPIVRFFHRRNRSCKWLVYWAMIYSFYVLVLMAIEIWMRWKSGVPSDLLFII